MRANLHISAIGHAHQILKFSRQPPFSRSNAIIGCSIPQPGIQTSPWIGKTDKQTPIEVISYGQALEAAGIVSRVPYLGMNGVLPSAYHFAAFNPRPRLHQILSYRQF